LWRQLTLSRAGNGRLTLRSRGGRVGRAAGRKFGKPREGPTSKGVGSGGNKISCCKGGGRLAGERMVHGVQRIAPPVKNWGGFSGAVVPVREFWAWDPSLTR